jgi:glycosyltransferase involved in cell wall biosynthesis
VRVAVFTDETVEPTARSVALRRFRSVLHAMNDAGIQPHLILLRDGGLVAEEISRCGYETTTLGCGSNKQLPLGALRLRGVLRKERFDVLHSFEVIPALVGGLAGALDSSLLKVFFRSHTYSNGLHAHASRVAGRLNNVTMGASEAVIECARTLDKTAAPRTCVCTNGVPDPRPVAPSETAALRGDLGLDQEHFVVLSVARLRYEKGIHVSLEAVGLLARRLDRPVAYVIVGGGPEEARLKSLTHLAEPATVHWIGHEDDLAPWYTLGDIVAIPSLREAFGLVAAEAASYGRPVAASSVGGLKEVLSDRETGLLVPAEDPHALSEAMLRLATDHDLASRIETHAKMRFRERFTMAAMIERWKTCYAQHGRAHQEGSVAE